MASQDFRARVFVEREFRRLRDSELRDAVLKPGHMKLTGFKRHLLPFEVSGFTYTQSVTVHHGNQKLVAEAVTRGVFSSLS